MRPAGPLDPIDRVLGALAEEDGDFLAQLRQPPVAFHQLLPDLLVLAQLDQLADRLPQALDGQGDVVLHQLRLADAQLGPLAPARRRRFAAAEAALLGRLLQRFARRLDVGEEAVGLLQQLGDELHRGALAQRGEQALLGAGIPEALQGVAHLAAGDAQPDVPGGDVFHVVRLVEDDEVIAEQDAALDFLLQAAEQGEEQRVVHHQHIRGEDAIARALEEADGVILAEVGRVTAQLGRAQAALGADLRPHLRVGLHLEVRQAAVGGGLGPFVNALQLLGLGGGKEVAGLLDGLVEAARAEVIAPAFEHGETELHRQDLLEHRQVLLRELLLQVDRVRGDDRLLLVGHGIQDRRHQVGQALADARAGLDRQVLAAGQGLRHRHGHFLLLRPELEVLRPRKNALRGKDRRDLLDKVLG